MKKLFLFIFSLIFLTLISADAAVYKGQKEFSKNCIPCHNNGQSFLASHTTKYWKNMMQKQGAKLVQLHLNDPKAKTSWAYFKSKKFTKKSKHLKQFLVEYAKDSGNVPACN
jgi:hypothetical protein